MSKSIFYVSEKKSAKYIVKANIDNKLYRDNAVIAHCYPNKNGFLVYLHENALNIALDTYEDNKRYVEKAKNEHFAKKFTIIVNRENVKDVEKTDKNAINELVKEFNTRALAILEAEKAKKESEKANAKSEKTNANATSAKKNSAKSEKISA